jgi:hypothetical protein
LINPLKVFLAHPHKKSVIKWFFKHPSLILTVTPRLYYHYCFINTFKSIFELNDISTINYMMPEKFSRFLKQEEFSYADLNWRLMLYYIIRYVKPEIVVETGVASGLSSAIILCAMHENQSGHLYSIDLPPNACDNISPTNTHISLADGARYGSFKTGKYIPDYLYYRWTLKYGDSKEILGGLLEEIGNIDIFFHDSLHTEDHMRFEYETSWSKIKHNGLLISHDVIWNDAFDLFSKKQKCIPNLYYSLGIIKKGKKAQ